MKAVHFGAGNIGRGFIGQVLHDNGFEITFVDTNEALIQQLNQSGSYEIDYLDEKDTSFIIKPVQAISSLKNPEAVIKAITEADIITTSVGVNNLKRIAPVLKAGLVKRAAAENSINVLANENAINASETLKAEIYELLTEAEKTAFTKTVFFVNTAIDRQSLSKEQDHKVVAVVEPYYEWVIAEKELDPKTPYTLKNVTLVADLTPYIERKLYIVNAAHAAFAYVGALFGYETVQAAMKDQKIYHLVHEFLIENAAYFVLEYGQDKTQLESFIQKTLKRHGNPKLADQITRVGRSPLRKLGPTDRLVAPVAKLAALGLPNTAGEKIIAAAFKYSDSEDAEARELQTLLQTQGFAKTAAEITKLSENLITAIEKNYQLISKDPDQIFK